MADEELELLSRELCPDGTCIGVIGSNGRCRECGAVAVSSLTHARNRGLVPIVAADGHDDPDAAIPDELADRELCTDGACIGVIGPDGRCRECGAAPASAAERDGSTASGLSAASPPAADTAGPGDDDAFEDRELCPDGACIGIIGSDGRCKDCGTAAAT